MSHENEHQPPKAPQHTTHASGGSGRKWLIGAAAAAILLGGGYLAYKNYGAGAPNSEVASNQYYDSTGEPARAGPLASTSSADDLRADDAREENAVPASTARSAANTTRRSSATRAASNTEATEEVVGVIPASASAEDLDGVVIEGARRPVWARAPSARRLSAVYPARALERGREGEASVHCVVQANGALDDCVRTNEFPQNAGFGRAAERVAHMYRHAPERYDGSNAVGTPVNLRVVFRVDDDNRRG